MKQKIKNTAAFTIIELIVVIAIIAVLVAIVLANVTSYIEKSKKAAAFGQLNQISKALQIYKSQYGCWPNVDDCGANNDDCQCTPPDELHYTIGSQETWDRIVNTLVKNGIIGNGNAIRTDPWNQPYSYVAEYPTNGTNTGIAAPGPDGDTFSWDGTPFSTPEHINPDNPMLGIWLEQRPTP